jgi:hypothetical protein
VTGTAREASLAEIVGRLPICSTDGKRHRAAIEYDELRARADTAERQLAEAQVALRQAASLIAMMAASRPMVESMDEHQRFIVDRVLAGIEKLTAIERSAESLPIRDLRRDEEPTND